MFFLKNQAAEVARSVHTATRRERHLRLPPR
jgi:hypothetical protein